MQTLELEVEVEAMASGALKWLIYLISAGLIVLGGLFLMASYPPYMYRLPEGLAFISVALVLLYFFRERKPIEISQEVTVSGPIKVKEVRCPNCGANLDVDRLEVVNGRPFMKCEYCGHQFELTEEPTW